MTFGLTQLRARLCVPDVRALLLWCLPALLLGFALRATLEVRMPRAFYHPDSGQIFETYRSAQAGVFHIHEKKTPLGPLLYTTPLLMHVPVLPLAAGVQHLLGLGIVVLVGALVAKSFARWRLFIVPVTVLVAVNPMLLWYEHVALPETFYVFAIVATAVAGLAYWRRPATPRLVALAVALFATAGLRPEGKLFCLFGLALVLAATWGNWKRLACSAGSMALLTALCFALNGTRQSGSLLYSNVAHLTPDRLWSAPGFAEAHREYFAELREKWAVTPTAGIAHERKKLVSLLRTYMEERSHARVRLLDVNKLCGRVGAEVCLRQSLRLPALTIAKFRFALRNPTAGDFGPEWLFTKQTDALSGSAAGEDDPEDLDASALEFARIAYGRDFTSRAEIESCLRELYRPFAPDWLTAWQDRYSAGVAALRLPDGQINGDILPGIPWLYLLVALGLGALALRDRRLRMYHLLWFGMLLGMLVVLTLTGSNLGRFRLGFEPFWVLYACALFDVLLGRIWRRHSGPRNDSMICRPGSRVFRKRHEVCELGRHEIEESGAGRR
jgi:hypothetical protein